jgi:hypothetical protein
VAWLEKLKALLNIDIKESLVNVNINVNSNNTKIVEYHEAERKLDINVNNIPPEKFEQMKPIVREYIGDDKRFLDDKTCRLLDELQKYAQESGGDDNKVRKFFENIMLPDDYEALESALYIRKASRNHDDDVPKLKKDIRDSFGDRGSNIANLCTAGYFESYLMPLYNNSPQAYKEYYEKIIREGILACFVHQFMKPEDIAAEISAKIVECKKYGIPSFHIHGFGRDNVRKIKEFVEEKKEFFNYFEKNIYEQKDKVIIIEIILAG